MKTAAVRQARLPRFRDADDVPDDDARNETGHHVVEMQEVHEEPLAVDRRQYRVEVPQQGVDGKRKVDARQAAQYGDDRRGQQPRPTLLPTGERTPDRRLARIRAARNDLIVGHILCHVIPPFPFTIADWPVWITRRVVFQAYVTSVAISHGRPVSSTRFSGGNVPSCRSPRPSHRCFSGQVLPGSGSSSPFCLPCARPGSSRRRSHR